MLEFTWPWVFAVLPLPWLLRRYLAPAAQPDGGILRVPSLSRFTLLAGSATLPAAARWRLLLCVIAWTLLVGACARPRWLGDPIELPVNGRDLMLAVDLSESMRETDFVLNNRPVDRLTATKAVAKKFIQRRVGEQFVCPGDEPVNALVHRATVIRVGIDLECQLRAGFAQLVGEYLGILETHQFIGGALGDIDHYL